MRGWWYLTVCLVAPQVWGVAVALVVAAWTRRRQDARLRGGEPPDYTV